MKCIGLFTRPYSSTCVYRHLASIARPLTALTRKNKVTGKPVRFMWDSECETAFEKLKILLVTAPVLQPPDLTKELYLWTDASTRGFGGASGR